MTYQLQLSVQEEELVFESEGEETTVWASVVPGSDSLLQLLLMESDIEITPYLDVWTLSFPMDRIKQFRKDVGGNLWITLGQ